MAGSRRKKSPDCGNGWAMPKRPELQAARFLRGVIERVLADGTITAEEYQEVYRAVEAVLPFEARQQAHAARVQTEVVSSVGT